MKKIEKNGSTRRQFLGSVGVAGFALAAPHIANAQAATLRITTWGGRWGELMRDNVFPAFEREMRCKVEIDSAFPFIPKLQASPRGNPIYDVLHTNSNEQWFATVNGMVEERVSVRDVPNLKDVYPYAVSEQMAGVAIFTSAIGLGYRTGTGFTPKSWRDLADRKLDGRRGMQSIPVGGFGPAHLMMLGKIYGTGLTDLDAAFKALEDLKPMKVVDFAGQIERMLLQGEIDVGLLHDSGVYRYDGQNQPIAFCAPTEGVLSLEQALALTPGSKVKELGNAYINFMLKPEIQKLLAEGIWYSPANRNVVLDEKYSSKLYTTPEKVAQLIQVDWKWYNARKATVDARVARILRT